MVKSRLSADLGKDHAAQIYKTILENTLQNICTHEFEILLYCFPDIHYSLFKHYENKYDLSLHAQVGNDLGMRMYNALDNHLSANQHVVLIGSDCVELNADYISDAFLALETGNDIVLSPTLDGGYALIGANRIDASLFSNISWSTSSVLRQTEEKINNLEWSFTCMSCIRDIDTLSDYLYFSKHKNFKHLFFDIRKPCGSTS